MAATAPNAPPLDSAVVVSVPVSAVSVPDQDVTARALHKRYEGLVTVRCKAIKGKGAWYWAHLEPFLVSSSDTGLPKAVKLRCSLCNAVFSASNPSRTASEHLKRGTCPTFSTSSAAPKPPISPPRSADPPSRKRHAAAAAAYQVSPLTVVDPSQFCTEIVYPVAEAAVQQQQQHLVLSGGKEDLGALAMLEDSVKKLKSPKASPGPSLSKTQIDSAVRFLADWVYESCGTVSFSGVDHPKFKAFLRQVGLPPISRRELAGGRLDACFEEAKLESEAKIQDAAFFQLAANGWKPRECGAVESVVGLTVNLPNGSSVFRQAVFTGGSAPSEYAEEVLWETIKGICTGGIAQQGCVGIVADRFKGKALRNLEVRNSWMVNLYCQRQGFISLIKDFCIELPLFKKVGQSCVKLANFFNTNSQVRSSFHNYQLQELEHACLIRVPPNSKGGDILNFTVFYAMLEDILTSSGAMRMVVDENSYKVVVCVEDPIAREVADMVGDVRFWSELEAVYSLIKLVRTMTNEIEAERPLVGKCLPLWEELRGKVKNWCKEFNVAEGPVKRIVERRFRKNYHPAWSAAFILDPFYLLRDNNGKYLPPFKCLTPEQEKDVDKLITRLVSREEAHIALMELMKWRSEGLDPLYAQAVQVKQRDPMTGKMKVANPQSSRLVWETCLSEFKSLGKVAVRLIFLHATSCGFKCNWSFLRQLSACGHSRAGMDRVQKMIFIAAHSKLVRRDFYSEEEKDAKLFANGEGHVIDEEDPDGRGLLAWWRLEDA